MEHTFWTALDKLVEQSEIIIDRPKGSGSDHTAGIDAILCTVDLLKRDSEIKILLDCTEEEKMLIYKAHNDTSCMKGILIRRTAGISYKP